MMPIQPQALLIRCVRCGWQTVWQPPSDALQITELPPARCPQCDHDKLEARPASGLARAWSQLKRMLS